MEPHEASVINIDTTTVSYGKTKEQGLKFSNVMFGIEQGSIFKRQKKTKKILNDVSGHIAPGQLACILGPSGSGNIDIFT
jgi:ABC-type dipeptide/oligopeptide/nickel transport system ATPase subunit